MMQLVNIEINGYRRLLDVSVNVDEPVICVVGPNESGKSSFLSALESFENSSDYDRFELSRGHEFDDDHTVIQCLYSLDEEDTDLVSKFGCIGSPRWYYLKKHVSGNTYHHVDPNVYRNTDLRKKLLKRINKTINNENYKSVINKSYPPIPDTTKDEESTSTLLDHLSSILPILTLEINKLSSDDLSMLRNTRDILALAIDYIPRSKNRYFQITKENLDELIEDEEQTDPWENYLSALSQRRPKFLFFDEDNRFLKGDYSLQEMDNPPSALKNLFDLAGVDSNDIVLAMSSGDHALRATLVENANRILHERFQNSWGQSTITVHFVIDPDVIRIMVNDENVISPIAERSDGLRAFVSLFAYTSTKSNSKELILLIDEAESHLHYDAQADLIRVFENQLSAEKIIYTTHSAGCLPSDLGCGIRVINPIFDDSGNNTGFSEIRNSFWTEGVGFSPLLLAMGANVLTFVPTRHALIAEGPSDMMLLPSIFREVTSLARLQFQVAPGIASVSMEEAINLELEAPRVAYLVDGDDSGANLRRKLISSGVPENSIVQLPNGYSLEDFLHIDSYIEAINFELIRSYGGQLEISSDDLGDHSRVTNLINWCNQNNINPPKKTKIATRLLSLKKNSRLVDEGKSDNLLSIYNEIELILFPNQI